jgi:hypothetical protein
MMPWEKLEAGRNLQTGSEKLQTGKLGNWEQKHTNWEDWEREPPNWETQIENIQTGNEKPPKLGTRNLPTGKLGKKHTNWETGNIQMLFSFSNSYFFFIDYSLCALLFHLLYIP